VELVVSMTYSFDFERNEWKRVEVLSEERPGFRENNGVVASGDSSRLTLFGGYDGNQWLNDLWVFDIAQNHWTCIQESSDPNSGDDTFGPSRRFGYASVVHRNKFVLFGGFDGVQWLWEFNFDTPIDANANGRCPAPKSFKSGIEMRLALLYSYGRDTRKKQSLRIDGSLQNATVTKSLRNM